MAVVNSAVYGDLTYWDGTNGWGYDPSDGSLIASEAASQAIYGNPRKGFATVAAWEADRDGNAQTGDDEFCYIQGLWDADDTDAVSIRDWSNVPASITLKTIGVARNLTGIYASGSDAPHRFVFASGRFRSQEVNVTIDGLQFYGQDTQCMYIDGTSTGLVVKNNICRCDSDTNGIETDESTVTILIQNNLVYCHETQGAGSEGIYINACSTAAVYNNTVWNFNDGIERDVGTVTGINNISANNNDDFDGTMTLNYNASDDGTGSNAIAASGGDWDNEFVDKDNENFNIKNTGNCFEGSAITYDDDNNVPQTDQRGTARNTGVGESVSVGCFEYKTVVSGGNPWYYYAQQ